MMDEDLSPPRVVVIAPAFNEEETVERVVRDVRSLGYDIVVVDDGSSDATASEGRRAGAVVLQLPVNLGVGGALRCGFRYAVEHGYDVAVQCDADGQHPADQIEVLLAAMAQTGSHLVVGSRFASATGGYAVSVGRRLAMRVLAGIARRRTGVVLTDTTSGFRAIGEPLLGQFARSYPTQYLGDTFEALVAAARAGYRVTEVEVSMRPRAAGRATASAGASVGYLVRAVVTVLLGTGRRVEPLAEARAS